MIRKTYVLLLLAAVFVTAAGLIYHSSNEIDGSNLATENVKIVKDSDDIWRVRDTANNANKGTMRVRRNDRVFWQPQGSRVQFIFHKNVNAYFNYESGLFADGKTQIVENGKMLRVTVKDNAPLDKLVYDVLVYADSSYVVGNSPPVMIVY